MASVVLGVKGCVGFQDDHILLGTPASELNKAYSLPLNVELA